MPVIGTVTALRAPLTIAEIDALAGLGTETLQTAYIDSPLPLLEVDGEERVGLLLQPFGV